MKKWQNCTFLILTFYKGAFLACQNLAVGRLFYVLVDYHFAYAVSHDTARCGVLYALDVSAYVRLEGGVFEGAVAFTATIFLIFSIIFIFYKTI